MSPTLNGSSAIQCFKRSNAIKIRDGITFDFYMRLPHILLYCVVYVKNAWHIRYICKQIISEMFILRLCFYWHNYIIITVKQNCGFS